MWKITNENRWEIVKGTSVNPDAVIRRWAGLRWADYDKDGNRIGQGEVWLCKPTDEELTEWDAQAKIIVGNIADNPVDNIYIRWGKIPKNEQSKNHATGEQEKGVSVFPAKFNPETCTYDYIPDGIISAASISHMLRGSTAYLVTGNEVGRGSDGEPVIKNIKIIGTLKTTENGLKLRKCTR